MDAGLSPLAFGVFNGIIFLAVWLVIVRWDHLPTPRPAPMVTHGPLDRDPHTVTLMGQNGRPNPSDYEWFPNYRAALLRQRELIRKGLDCIVTHAASGAVRVDIGQMLCPYHRISL